ncbi:hypothetical protein VCHA47P369_20484 [Vibrio chagasii]|nr:hypothetical protein VCHA47P369_20484 [Vibrio chagasii]
MPRIRFLRLNRMKFDNFVGINLSNYRIRANRNFTEYKIVVLKSEGAVKFREGNGVDLGLLTCDFGTSKRAYNVSPFHLHRLISYQI